MPPADEQSFLVVRLGSLGDLMHTLPAVSALRSTFPRARVDWVVDRKWAPLVELVTGVDHVIPWRRDFFGSLAGVRELQRTGYTCAIDFQGLYKSALLARFSGTPRRIGFHSGFAREPGAARFYTERVIPTGKHVAEMNLSLAAAAGARQSKMSFPLRVPAEGATALDEMLARESVDEYCVVSPGGGWKSKCWPAERYGELCAELWQRHSMRVVVNAGPGELEQGRAVVVAAGAAKPVVFSPTLRELVTLLAQARLVVAADTGPLHLAAALGTSVVALFGPTDPARNGPVPAGAVLRNAADKDTTYKRGEDYSPWMLALTVDQVTAAVERGLGERS